MFVATKQLKVIGRDGKTSLFRPGDEVVGFENWPEVPKRAHLNLEYVIQVKGKQPLECGECGSKYETEKALKCHTSKKHKG